MMNTLPHKESDTLNDLTITAKSSYYELFYVKIYKTEYTWNPALK